MRQGQYELEIIVNGKPVFEYAHKGDTYIEGRKGSTFKLRFKNSSSNKLLVVPAVDGVSTLDGKPAGPDSPGLVVQGNSHIDIPGWMVDSTKASEFIFADRESSYARSIDRTTTNTGVIGLIVFGEAEKERHVTNINVTYPTVYPTSPYYTPPFIPSWGQPIWISSSNPTYNVSNTSVTLGTNDAFGAIGAAGPQGPAGPQGTSRRITPKSEENLGVGWGQSVDFTTTSTTFDKGEKLSQIVVYYDSRKNLERMGIIVEPRASVQTKPNPFPGVGCKPPAGWRG